MNLLNLSGDQRLDLGDLTYALSTVPTGLVNELTSSFCLAPGESAIVTGFRPAASGTTAVVVGEAGVPNVAFLGQRIAAAVTPGVLTMQGPATQTVSTATLPAATYTVFIRFNRISGVSQTRKFWAKSLPGNEYSQLADTRQVATWEVRLETSAPSAEWVPIATAVVTAAGAGQGNTVVVTDTRLLYFEGRVDQGFAPVWGSAADRSNDRTVANSGSLRRQLDAIRACLADVKGRGLSKWYQPNISGMLLGTAFTLNDLPQPNQVSIGDSRFYLKNTSNTPIIGLDDTNDYLTFNRGAGAIQRFRAGVANFSVNQLGGAQFGINGLSSSFITVNATATGGYGLSVNTVASNAKASLGLVSAGTTEAFLEMGQTGFNNGYFVLSTKWASPIKSATFSLTDNFSLAKGFVSCVLQNSRFRTDIRGDDLILTSDFLGLNANTYSFSGRNLLPAMFVWSAGVYFPGSTNSDNLNIQGTIGNAVGIVPTATYVNDSGNHHSILLQFPQAFPPQATPIVSGWYDVSTGKVYQCGYQVISSTQMVVGIANAADNPVNKQFTFYIYYGS